MAKRTKKLNISYDELIDALNSPRKCDALMKEKNVSKQELVAHAAKLISSLSSSIIDVNVV